MDSGPEHAHLPRGTGEPASAGTAMHAVASGVQGFIVRFSDGGRWKVKFEVYMLAHRAISAMSFQRLLAAFQGGCTLEEVTGVGMLTGAQIDRIEVVWAKLGHELDGRLQQAQATAARLMQQTAGDRKAFALAARAEPDTPALFKILDGKPEENVREPVFRRMSQELNEYLRDAGEQGITQDPAGEWRYLIKLGM